MEVTLSRRLKATPALVFQVFTDLENAAQNVSGIARLELLTEGPVGTGTRFRETRIMLKREATEEMEITEYVLDRTYTVAGFSCGSKFTTRFDFEPVENGKATEVVMKMTATPQTFFARLMSPLGRLMAGSMKACLERDLDDLQKAAEQRPLAQETGQGP